MPGPNGTSRSLGHKDHDPVWARLAEASVPVAFHLGDSGYQRTFAPAWGSRNTFGFGNSEPFAQVLVSDRAIHDTIASMVMHGVFKRHPALRVAADLGVPHGSYGRSPAAARAVVNWRTRSRSGSSTG